MWRAYSFEELGDVAAIPFKPENANDIDDPSWKDGQWDDSGDASSEIFIFSVCVWVGVLRRTPTSARGI